jgi:hypothetical protein
MVLSTTISRLSDGKSLLSIWSERVGNDTSFCPFCTLQGLPLAASIDDEQVRLLIFLFVRKKGHVIINERGQTETDLSEPKQQSKLIFRRLTAQSEPCCSIESGPYTLQ